MSKTGSRDSGIAWRKGSMVFEFTETDSTFPERFVSKKNEPPSSFIKRVLQNSKNMRGESVWGYLKDEMDDHPDDVRIRTVKVLGDRARKTATEMGLKEDDLVIVRTYIEKGKLPRYELEKIEGSPIEYLQRRMIK
jgi:hypothetical protein